MSPTHLYVHVPFCLRRCTYCDFAVHPGRRPDVAGWQAAIARELALSFAQNAWQAPLPLKTVYVGGGTPSLLGVGGMTPLLAELEEWFTLPAGAELTVEANPESFTAELAEDWQAAGVNRLSMGVQTWDEGALRWMGRLHGPAGADAALAAARRAGFDNLNLDLIFGLPERLGRDWRADLERAVAAEPEHISLYGLTAEAGTALGRWVGQGRESVAGDERYQDEYLLAAELLRAAGYTHYEVSNFARPGRASQHNAAYWQGSPYLGIGPGAHSYVAPHRWWNERDYKRYRSALLEEGRLPRTGEERLDAGQAALERIWLGLRTSDGLDLSEWPTAVADRVQGWKAAGWRDGTNGRVRLTPQGWLLLDQLALELGTVAA